MDKREWNEAVLSELVDSAMSAGLIAEKRELPADLTDIGGGAGFSFILQDANKQQVAAITRYDDKPECTVVYLTEHGSDTLRDQIRQMADRIAGATQTRLNLQGAFATN